MKMLKLSLGLVLSVSAILSTCASVRTDAVRSGALVIVAPGEGACVPLLTSKQRRFVNMDFAARAKYFVDANKALRSAMRTWGTTPKPVPLEWRGAAGPYEVVVRKRGAVSEAFRTTVATNRVLVWNLEIGADYEWSVAAGGETAKGWFVTDATAPRFVKVGGVVNCRDLGGRVGLGGRRVRQGLVYRTAEYNRSTTKNNPPPSQTLITPEGRSELCGRLGVRTDLDLRRPDEYVGVTASPLGPGVAWICHHGSVFCYSNVVTSVQGREQFRKVFRVFLDEANYPIAFHCRGGADRTGTVGMVINALLGVGEEDLWKDYQVTAMWGTVGDARHFRVFRGLLAAFDRYPGETLCARVEAYVRDLGFSDADIETLRRILLEDEARPDLVARVAKGDEFVSVAVSDPSGVKVWRDDCVDGPSGWNSVTNVRPGIWSLKIGRPTSGRFEGHYLALRGAMPPAGPFARYDLAVGDVAKSPPPRQSSDGAPAVATLPAGLHRG